VRIPDVIQSEVRSPGRQRTDRLFVRLHDQHENILRQIQLHLSKDGDNRIRDRRDIRSGHMTTGSFVQLRKLLAEHQREEERIILPVVNVCLDSSASAAMRREYAHIREALTKLKMKRMQANRSYESLQEFLDSAEEFEAMVRRQFSREENVIYWFASLYLAYSSSLPT